MILLDSSALIALITGERRGKEVLTTLSDAEENAISIISIAEVTRWCMINKIQVNAVLKRMRQIYTILTITDEIAQESGRLLATFHKSRGIGMTDALIYATARKHKAQLITLDTDFKEFEGTTVIR